MANKTSPYILSTAANLLGFCLFVIASMHIGNVSETQVVDELTSVIAVILTVSCIFSFISIRTDNLTREQFLEKIADYLFVISLIGILIIILLITMDYV